MLVEEKVKTNNFLITVTSDEIKNMKVKGLNFLFPILGYSVGYTKYYKLDEIDIAGSFIYINRILDKEAIIKLENDLKKLSKNIIGICFTDLGVIQIVKKLNLDLKLIYMQNHNTTNFVSINYYLENIDSVLVSTDITKEEIMDILDNADKPLVLPYFMLVDVMYSRRKLLSNFQNEFNLTKNEKIELNEKISKKNFISIENEYGTMVYDKEFIDYRAFKYENILYYYINPIGLTSDEVKKIINGEDISVLVGDGFLNKKTYYRLKGTK